jgi:hypothetical protein
MCTSHQECKNGSHSKGNPKLRKKKKEKERKKALRFKEPESFVDNGGLLN